MAPANKFCGSQIWLPSFEFAGVLGEPNLAPALRDHLWQSHREDQKGQKILSKIHLKTLNPNVAAWTLFLCVEKKVKWTNFFGTKYP